MKIRKLLLLVAVFGVSLLAYRKQKKDEEKKKVEVYDENCSELYDFKR